jgi:hypothetical protein
MERTLPFYHFENGLLRSKALLHHNAVMVVVAVLTTFLACVALANADFFKDLRDTDVDLSKENISSHSITVANGIFFIILTACFILVVGKALANYKVKMVAERSISKPDIREELEYQTRMKEDLRRLQAFEIDPRQNRFQDREEVALDPVKQISQCEDQFKKIRNAMGKRGAPSAVTPGSRVQPDFSNFVPFGQRILTPMQQPPSASAGVAASSTQVTVPPAGVAPPLQVSIPPSPPAGGAPPLAPSSSAGGALISAPRALRIPQPLGQLPNAHEAPRQDNSIDPLYYNTEFSNYQIVNAIRAISNTPGLLTALGNALNNIRLRPDNASRPLNFLQGFNLQNNQQMFQ